MGIVLLTLLCALSISVVLGRYGDSGSLADAHDTQGTDRSVSIEQCNERLQVDTKLACLVRDDRCDKLADTLVANSLLARDN